MEIRDFSKMKVFTKLLTNSELSKVFLLLVSFVWLWTKKIWLLRTGKILLILAASPKFCFNKKSKSYRLQLTPENSDGLLWISLKNLSEWKMSEFHAPKNLKILIGPSGAKLDRFLQLERLQRQLRRLQQPLKPLVFLVTVHLIKVDNSNFSNTER